MNIADAIHAHARSTPDLPALIDRDASLTYGQLDAAVDAAALRLRAHGARPGDIVMIVLREGALQVALTFGALRLGAVVCTLDWRSRPAERTALAAALSPRLVLVDRAPAAGDGTGSLQVDPDWLSPGPSGEPLAAMNDPAAAAILLLSSGTTGRPKATVISHRAAAWRGIIRRANFGFRPGTRVLSAMPLSTSAGLSGLLGQITAGASITFHPTLYSPEQLVEALRRQKSQHVAIVPTVMRWMLALPGSDGPLLPDITAMLVLGAQFRAEEKRAALSRVTPHLYENYGSAGTGTICTATPDALASHPDSVGRPPFFTRVEIVDPQGRVLPAGETGRVRVRTPGAASGYFGDTGDAEQHELFGDGWVYPGDLGRLDGEGRLYLEGRAANLILRGGQNIYPEEIEQVLLDHPAVAEAAVAARPDSLLGEVPVALIVPRGTVQPAALAVHCRARLQAAKVPVEFRLVPALPKTAAGKVRRAALRALLEP